MRTLATLVLVASLAACGSSAQHKLLMGTVAGLNAAREGFFVYDEQHQADLVAQATTYEGGVASLTLYREKRERVIEGFFVAYTLVIVALEDTTVGRVAAAVRAAEHVYRLVRELMDSEKRAPTPPPAPSPNARVERRSVVV